MRLLRRAKLSHDPNNTNWSRSTSNYGHKMLISQGWTPGSFLGAVNAPHSILHTDANTSHIRIALKDDNLGLGARRKIGQEEIQCTGLDTFQDLLGRLNGKSGTELEKEQRTRDDLKRASYTERRWGALRFVSGGILVGDSIQELANGERLPLVNESHLESPRGSITSRPHVPETTVNVERRTKASKDQLEARKHRGSRHQSVCESEKMSQTSELADITVDKAHVADVLEDAVTQSRDINRQHKNSTSTAANKGRRKVDKAQRKLDRRRKKEARAIAKTRQQVQLPLVPHKKLAKTQILDHELEQGNGMSTVESNVQVNTCGVVGGRHAVRRRFIQQKQMAMLDPKALNEVNLNTASFKGRALTWPFRYLWSKPR